MLSQLAQFAPLYNVILQDAAVDLRATFDSSAKYGLSENPTAFEKVTIKIDIKSPSDPALVRQLVAHTERGCHASQTMQNPVPVAVEAHLNRALLD
jgi:organic hydroperoxide reductase OsmC/OhrA